MNENTIRRLIEENTPQPVTMKHLWISVEDELPEGVFLIVWAVDGDEAGIVIAAPYQGIWYDKFSNRLDRKVTHWMKIEAPVND